MRSRISLLLALVCLGALLVPEALGAVRQKAPPEVVNPVAKMLASGSDVWFEPVVPLAALSLSYSGPDGIVREQVFSSGETAYITVSPDMPDGIYKYELRVTPLGVKRERAQEETEQLDSPVETLVQNGSFLVSQGRVVTDKNAIDREGLALDVVNADDVIVQGSLGVGIDSVSGQDFGFDTIRLSENNLRIKFDDTSVGTFPANDWQLTANDSASGGLSYFSIDDITGSKVPFKVEAGASSNSLYIDSTGRIGLRTATPVLDLHVKTSNTPSFRLEQDNSGGFTAQTWDIAGNEANFFVRDVTGGSRLPLRIRPGAPTSSLDIAATGNVGIGTGSPAYALEIERTGANAAVVAERTDGASNYMNATATYANFGSVNNFPLRLMVNGTWRMMINTDNSLSLVNGASCTAGGAWVNASSRDYKDNISGLTSEEAVDTLEALTPVKYTYKADETDPAVGFIAEDVPDLVATKDRKSLSPMDIVAVLTRVVQEQQKTMLDQQQSIAELNRKIAELEAKLK